jgi:RpiR family carbohydrate utilization transcriptional regulator
MADILSTIRSSMAKLRNSEKKVAECVLQNPDAAMRSTITDLAEMAAVSEPTVIRFCRKLGLSGYMELRLSLANALPTSKYIVENVSAEDHFPDIFNKLFNSAKDAFNNTMNNLDLKTLELAANTLADADRIEFYGLGGSGVVAMDAHHKFFRIGVPCIAYDDPHMQVMSAALLTEKDAVVAISHTGSTKDILESVKVAKRAGAAVIGITGSKKTPLAKYCDYAISVNSQEVALRLAPMTSRLVQLAIIDVLFVSIAMRDFNEIKEKLDKVKMTLVDKRY